MVDPKPDDRVVKVRDINIRYVDWGDNGPTLLLLHGSMRTSRSWDAMARALHDRFHVIALDARGHGDSDWTKRGYGYTNMVQDLGAFFGQLAKAFKSREGNSATGHQFAALRRNFIGHDKEHAQQRWANTQQ